jgi:hypothetical protein
MLPDSNVTLLREKHEVKQLLPITITADGMEIDSSDEHP